MSGENINSQPEATRLAEEQRGFQSLGKEVPFASASPEAEPNEAKFINLEELDDFCSWDNCIFRGHGTGRSGDAHEVVDSIFREGIRGNHGKTDIFEISSGLPYPQDQSEELKAKLDNWQHYDSKNIILVRLPAEYFTEAGYSYEPYFTAKQNADGKDIYYLDSRFILGNYNTETGLVELNDKFEPEITGDFRVEMDNRCASIKAATAAQQAEFERQAIPGIDYSANPQPDPDIPPLEEFDFNNWDDYSEEDWE